MPKYLVQIVDYNEPIYNFTGVIDAPSRLDAIRTGAEHAIRQGLARFEKEGGVFAPSSSVPGRDVAIQRYINDVDEYCKCAPTQHTDETLPWFIESPMGGGEAVVVMRLCDSIVNILHVDRPRTEYVDEECVDPCGQDEEMDEIEKPNDTYETRAERGDLDRDFDEAFGHDGMMRPDPRDRGTMR